MEDEDDDAVFEEKPCVAKLSRKVGEKLRRDRLNSLITQLAEEIPIIKYAHRRLDKSAILRLTVSYMKLHLGLKRKNLGRTFKFNGTGLLDWLKKVTSDVLLIISQSGIVIYVSPKIIDILGFYQTDMVGHNIKLFVHQDDLDVLMSQFSIHTDVAFGSAFTKYSTDSNSSMPNDLQMFSTDCKSFCIRMMKAARRKQIMDDTMEYETICVRANCEKTCGVENINSSVDELWMLAMLKPFSSEPMKAVDVKISEFMKNNEWASMHDMNSRILANDQRSSLFSGFLASELVGKTPYLLICEDDLESVAISHQMIMKNHHIPSTVFRMNNKFNMAIYIQSESIIVKDHWTKNPKYIVSVNRVLGSDEGRCLLNAQKKITKEFAESEKRDVESLVQVKQEVKSSDITDSCNGPCWEHSGSSAHSVQERRESDGKNLKEIYDKKSQNFPELYVPGDSCSNVRIFSDSEKRSFDCVDSDSSGLESASFTYTPSDTSSISATEEVWESPKGKSPCLKDLLSDEKGFNDACIYSKARNNSTDQDSLLKGILQGKVKMNGVLCAPDKLKDSDRNTSKTTRKIHIREFISPAVTAKENGASCLPSVPMTTYVADCHAAAGHSPGVQSPTVDSSEVLAVASSAESSIDPCSVKSSVHCRFTSQLGKKHSMLKQTIDNQKLTLEVLKDQLQKSHNNVVLSSQQKKVHDMLIEKITEAENQVTVQGELLEELEQEITQQKT